MAKTKQFQINYILMYDITSLSPSPLLKHTELYYNRLYCKRCNPRDSIHLNPGERYKAVWR